MNPSHQIVIVGGGSAGISIAARLARQGLDIAIIEPSDKHYYQPLWTLVGGGVFPREATERNEADLIPKGTTWIRERVASFDPAANAVILENGDTVQYEQLVVAAGIQVNWNAVEGLEGNVGRNGICSNYSYETVNSTWEAIRSFRGGEAVFTQPSSPIKCGGAPQKICYLAEHAFVRQGVRDKTTVRFRSGLGSIFSVLKYKKTLEQVIARKKIDAAFKQELVAVDADAQIAVFRDLDSGSDSEQPFDLLHVTPPMSAPQFIADSPLSDDTGWVTVDKETLQHVEYPNVFSAGDCSNLPTSKTGAAIRKQAPVLVSSLLAHRKGAPLTGKYDGYTSCPLVTGYGSLILAEFDYDLNPAETFPIDQSKERWSMYQLKAHLLPPLYWKGMLRGRA